jgi:hypothetical protein
MCEVHIRRPSAHSFSSVEHLICHDSSAIVINLKTRAPLSEEKGGCLLTLKNVNALAYQSRLVANARPEPDFR